MANQVVPGFSLTNRILLYASILLSPAQYQSGVRNNIPTNLGFLAYNWYTQIQWYQAVKQNQIHALSMVLPHFNFIYAASYLGGVTSGNPILGAFLGFGTAGVLLLNTASAWISWSADQPQGFGVYQFFFFGWRTLDRPWHNFLLFWQIGDTIIAVLLSVLAIVHGITFPILVSGSKSSASGVTAAVAAAVADVEGEGGGGGGGGANDDADVREAWSDYGNTLLYIPIGAVASLVGAWELGMWTEFIVARNKIESATDWIAVWLFIAQVVAMLIPPYALVRRLFTRSWKN